MGWAWGTGKNGVKKESQLSWSNKGVATERRNSGRQPGSGGQIMALTSKWAMRAHRSAQGLGGQGQQGRGQGQRQGAEGRPGLGAALPGSPGAGPGQGELRKHRPGCGRLASGSISRFSAGDLGMSGLFPARLRRTEAEAAPRSPESPPFLHLCPFPGPGDARPEAATTALPSSSLHPPPALWNSGSLTALLPLPRHPPFVHQDARPPSRPRPGPRSAQRPRHPPAAWARRPLERASGAPSWLDEHFAR